MGKHTTKERARRFFYGLPQFGRPGVKLARHRTAGMADDPHERPQIDDDAVDDIRDFMTRRFTAGPGALVSAEHCFYTNTKTEDYILDHHPDDSRVVIGSGFSGHGFKLAPLTGRILSELLVDGRTSVPEFEACRARFAL